MKSYIILFSILLFSSCSSDSTDSSSNSNTIDQEINPAKIFYANNGGTFKLRLYQFPPTEGNSDNYNYHTAEIYKIIDGIGSIGTGWSSLNTITLHKNPNNLNNPYMVVRHYNSDILDIYKFNGTAIEVVKTGITLPTSITLLPGDTTRVIKDIVFSGSNIYLISGKDKNLYKLSGSSFVIEKPNLTVSDDRISALESTPNGVLISIVKTIPSTPLSKIVSDVVFISN